MIESPWSREAEAAVIGAALVYPETFDGVGLVPADFYLSANRCIWDAMGELRRGDRAIDVTTVLDRLKARGDETAQPHAVECVKSVTHLEMLAHHVAIVSRDSARRRLMALAAELGERAARVEDVAGTMASARQELERITAAEVGAPVRVGDVLTRVLDAIEAKKDKPWERATPTGIGKFDRLMGGLRPGRVIVVAARPGIGKSSLMRGFCLNAAVRHRVPTLVFSLEVLRDELIEQFLASEASVSGERIDRGDLTADEFGKLFHADPRLRQAPLWVDDRTLSITQISAAARKWRGERREPLVQIAVDYLGLVPPAERSSTREREVAQVSWTLKTLARDLACPVIALSQLNRKIEDRGPDAEPKLSDLRESGAIEQDAHMVVFVHRQPPLDTSGPAKLIIAKNRAGRTGAIDVHWNAEFMTFTEAAAPHEIPKNWQEGER